MSDVDYEPIPAATEEVARLLIGCSITVHRRLGPGYKEPIYHRALCVELEDLHRMQVRSYLKAAKLRLGYVLNFNSEVMKHGIKRVVL